MNDELTVEILDSLNWDYDKELNPYRYKNTKTLIAGDVILELLNYGSVTKAASALGVTYKVLQKAAQESFTPIYGECSGGSDNWPFKFLFKLGKKKCHKCNEVKVLIDFAVDKQASSAGVKPACKVCTNEFQLGHHIKYADSFAKSQEKNKDKIYARNARYKAERKLRLPSWSETKEIEGFYANCPGGNQVDHELPLKGEFVSGLHVLANLQYLTEEENLSKGNRIDLDAYNKKHYGT